MAEVITVEKNGYTLQVAVPPGLKKKFTRTVMESATGMLFYLFKCSSLQKSAVYVFHLSNGTYDEYTNHQLCMYLKNITSKGWRMGIRFGSSEAEAITGWLQLPKGITPEFTLVKLRQAIKSLNENSWKGYQNLVRKKKLAKSPATKTLKVVSPTDHTLAPSSQVVSLPSLVRRSQVAKPLLDDNFIIDLVRVIEIQVRVREIDAGVQQFRVELDAYAQLNQSLNFARIIEIQDRLQQLASEVQQLVAERKVFEKAIRARTKSQLIRSILS